MYFKYTSALNFYLAKTCPSHYVELKTQQYQYCGLTEILLYYSALIVKILNMYVFPIILDFLVECLFTSIIIY